MSPHLAQPVVPSCDFHAPVQGIKVEQGFATDEDEDVKDIKPLLANEWTSHLDQCGRDCCVPDIFFTPSTRFTSHADFVSSCCAASLARFGTKMISNYVSATRMSIECPRRHRRAGRDESCKARISVDWVKEEGLWRVDFEGTTRWAHNHPPLEEVLEKEKEATKRAEDEEQVKKLEEFLRDGPNGDLDDDDNDDEGVWWVASSSSLAMHRLVQRKEAVFEQQRQQSKPGFQCRSAALLFAHLSCPSSSSAAAPSSLYTPALLRRTLLQYLHFTHTLLSLPPFPISNALIALFLFSRCARAGRREAAGVLATLQACQAVIAEVWDENEGGEEDEERRREAMVALEEFVRERPAERAISPELAAQTMEQDDSDDDLELKFVPRVDVKGKEELAVVAVGGKQPGRQTPSNNPSSPQTSRKRSLFFADSSDTADECEGSAKRARVEDAAPPPTREEEPVPHTARPTQCATPPPSSPIKAAFTLPAPTAQPSDLVPTSFLRPLKRRFSLSFEGLGAAQAQCSGSETVKRPRQDEPQQAPPAPRASDVPAPAPSSMVRLPFTLPHHSLAASKASSSSPLSRTSTAATTTAATASPSENSTTPISPHLPVVSPINAFLACATLPPPASTSAPASFSSLSGLSTAEDLSLLIQLEPEM
ncbi:hypothetical protein JCM6882_005389 [Rhodosporidiobolus microsporus]